MMARVRSVRRGGCVWAGILGTELLRKSCKSRREVKHRIDEFCTDIFLLQDSHFVG